LDSGLKVKVVCANVNTQDVGARQGRKVPADSVFALEQASKAKLRMAEMCLHLATGCDLDTVRVLM